MLAGYARVIRCFLNWCLEEEAYELVVKPAVVKKIKMPKTQKSVIDIFTTAQLQALFVACQYEYNEHLQVRARAILSVLIDTGIRASELCTLTLEHTHLDPGDAFVKVLGKGRKEREVGLGTLSRQALEDYIIRYRGQAGPQEPVFIGRYSEPLTPDGLEQIITRLGSFAEISGVRCSPHTFRHSFAVSYLLAGGDLYKLSLLMGHEKTEVTEIYLRTIQARQARQGGLSVLDQIGVGTKDA